MAATVVILAAAVLATGHPAQAQSPEAEMLVIPRLDTPIELDGRIEEPAWREARALRLVQNKPVFGAEPTEKTEVLIGYTDSYVYAACRCYDRKTPLAPSFKRDFAGWSDAFQLIFDTFNDNENAVGFSTTPTGLRLDLAVRDDATGGYPLDIDWNTVWDVEVLQNEEGWFAEMRIPISSLRFQVENGRVVMGLIAMRFIVRNNEIATFPAIPPNWGTFSHMKPSQARDAAFEDLEPRTPLRITPYLLAGMGQRNVLNAAETGYRLERNTEYDAGLDIKYGLTSNLTLDLTVNTDFAQVEADNQQVNLTRFPLFFPEKRRFFLERASNFAFEFGRQNRLFYSRRIGLQAGRQVRILGGARLVGRTGPWDVGVLNMQTARASGIGLEGESLPSENFGVVRLRRRVVNPYSYVGGIVTSRIGMNGAYNAVYGVDGIFRVAGDEYLAVKWAQTFEDGAPNRLASLDPVQFLLQWERRRYEGFSYDLSYMRSGEHYDPGIGFTLRDDYTRVSERVAYGWLPRDASWIQGHRFELAGTAFFRNGDRSLETLEFGPAWELETNAGHSFEIEATHRVEDLRRPFALSRGAAIPAGRHAFQTGEVSYRTPGGRILRGRVKILAGRFFDGWRRSLQLRPTWNASRYFRMDGTYQFDRVDFPERNEVFTSHIGRFRLEVTPNVKYSLQAFIQYSSAIDGVAANIRFRYNPREGNDLYLVFNERLNTDRAAVYPQLPLSSGRTVLVKYTYTFDL